LKIFLSRFFQELIAGKLTRLLVGTRNNGSQNFIVESIDGSLRYPQDYTYYIQNFTSLRAEKLVESGLESTFEYLFMPSETFNGRPMGLVVLINYRNNVKQKKTFVIYNLRLFRKENDFKMLFSIKQLILLMLKKDLMVKRKTMI
jgi:translocon-associated protein subunit alpha